MFSPGRGGKNECFVQAGMTTNECLGGIPEFPGNLPGNPRGFKGRSQGNLSLAINVLEIHPQAQLTLSREQDSSASTNVSVKSVIPKHRELLLRWLVGYSLRLVDDCIVISVVFLLAAFVNQSGHGGGIGEATG